MTVSTAFELPTFRPAVLADLTGISMIEKAEFKDRAYPYFVIRQLYDLHGARWLVAEIDNELVGYAIVAVGNDDRAWVLTLAVAPPFVRRGFGSALLERAVSHCASTAIKQIFLTVRPGNDPAERLYRKLGFIPAAHEPRYFGPDEPRDVLVRNVDPGHDPSAFADSASDIWRKNTVRPTGHRLLHDPAPVIKSIGDP
ncbi:GNAT family N-acetyltransferase [Nocardia sp. NPDC057353]|uniref:GNAT family N-acetyltransferase n=1 Tax=Nocardia sp. NPDC057353 TaxID=3346104 RepID=UPI003640776E